MNPEQLFAHVRKLVSSLSPSQIAGLVAVFVGVVGVVVGSAYWLSVPEYTLLVSDMDAETASAVVSRLKAQKVPYELDDGGRTVRVPVGQADELRLQLASGGLPSAGRIGFEIFDRPAFGTTEFQEQVNFKRALEGELERTISTLSEVAAARVHITLAEDSLFVDENKPAKASVVLRLRDNRPLPQAAVRGIAGLVSSSVASLAPEAVVILDTNGRPLTKPQDDGTGLGTSSLERQQQIENALGTRVVALLEPVVGAGRVRVNVSAQLRHDRIEQTEEQWDPQTVVRSRATTTETGAGAVPAGGVAGARANQPPELSTSTATDPAADAPALDAPAGSAGGRAVAAGLLPGRTSETTNYEVSRLTRHTISPEGDLARLSVAVILDDERVTSRADDGTVTTTTRAWPPEQLTRFQNLVAAAVGLDPQRGDVLTVENVAFEAPVPVADTAPPAALTRVLDVVADGWPAALRWIVILGLALFALQSILRPMARRLSTVSAAATAAGGPMPLPQTQASARLSTVSELEGQIEAELDASPMLQQSRRLPVLTRRLTKIAQDEPEQMARIVRGWMTEEER